MAEDNAQGAAKGGGDWVDQRAQGATADATRAATDAMRDGTDQAGGAFQEHVVDPARRAGEAMRESGQRMAEGGSTIGTKLLDQVEANTQQAFAAMRAAAGAKDIGEVMKIQSDYLREQGNRSMTQAREIGELIMQFGRSAVAPLKGGGNDAA